MKQIAAVFGGVRREQFEEIAKEIPLMPRAVETVGALRRAGYRVGIVTDSYNCVAEIVRRRVFADFCFSHFMQFKNGRASGRVTLCPAMIHPHGCSVHDHCKMNVLNHLSERFGITHSNIVAVGDGDNDVCMLKTAGCSVAFRPKTRDVRNVAQFVTHSLDDVPFFAGINSCEDIRTTDCARAEESIEETISG
jgi:phosphoserine phosphatase